MCRTLIPGCAYIRKDLPSHRNQTGTACGRRSAPAVTSQTTGSFFSLDSTPRVGTASRLEGKALHQVADAPVGVARRRWRADRTGGGFVVAAARRARVEEVVR